MSYEYKSKSIYTRAIAISPEKIKKIDELRGKKSKAGKLNEIIEFYLLKNISMKKKNVDN